MNSENSDFRQKYILHPGDTITSGNTVYTITNELVAYGGSSVIYSAVASESSQKSPIKYIIKEVFPSEHLFERQSGIIRPRDPNNAGELKFHRDHIVEEQTHGGLCYNKTNLAVPIRHVIHPDTITIDGKEYTEDIQDGVFAVLDDISGKARSFSQMLEHIRQPKNTEFPLQNGGCPTLHTTACMIEQVLITLRAIHNNRVLFGDIHMDNVWFSKDCLELGKIHTSCFMDFGCSRPLIDGKKTDVIGGSVFSSRGFIPPEMLPEQWAQGDGTISIQADIFSVGCLMLRCLFPKDYWIHFGASPVIGPRTLQRDDMKRLGIDNSLRRKVNDILAQAMHPDPEKRFPSADAMLKAIQELKWDTEPPTYLLPKAPGSSESFVEGSRKKEISDIMQKLETNTTTFLWGCPGIGKSEVSIKVAQEFEKTSPKGSYFVHYTLPTDEDQEAMEETVLRMPFSGYKYVPERTGMSLEEQRKAEYKARIHILREHYAGALLVIDNFDWPGKTHADLTAEKSYLEMESIGLNLLFTTRSEVPGTPEVKELSREDLLRLMRRWVTDPRITDQQLYDLIEEVDGHTLTVDIIAKTLSEEGGRITPEMILEALRDSKLAETDYPEVTHRPLIKAQDPDWIRHRDQKTAQIYGHLKALIDLSKMNQEEKNVLCCATLLPDSGMDALLFSACLELGERKNFWRLIKQGWLKKSDDNVVSIHPIVRAVCRNELVDIDKDRDNNLRFLNKLLFAAKKQCESGAGLEFADNKMRQVVIVCEELAKRIGIVYITEDTWKEINNLLKVMGNYHLITQVKAVYPSIGQTRIPYAENDRSTGIRSFILDESNNIQYTIGIIGFKAGSEPMVKALATTTTISGNQQYKKVYIALDEMSEADCMLIFAFHKDIQVMYRYIGYLSPMGVMLNPNPSRIPRVFIHNQGNDRKTMVRVVEFSVHEVSEDLFGGRTVEEVESTFQGKVLMINPDDIGSILLSGKEIKEESQYYADFIFSKQDGISFMH